MRIIHTGDLHLDSVSRAYQPRRDSLPSSSSTQRWRTFQRLVSYVNDCEADLLLICGDLFHRQPTETELKEADSLFSTLTHTQVVIIAGNHDFLAPDSPMAEFEWSGPVTLLPEYPDSQVLFSSLNTVVHGFSYTSFQLSDPVYEDVSAPDDNLYHLLMIHGGDADHLPLQFSALEESGFDYIALGHIHKPQIFPGRQMAYCGSPEPLNHTETGNHGFMQVDIDCGEVQLAFVPFSHTRFIPLSLRVTPDDTIFSLRRTLTDRIANGRASDLYSITFVGERDPELSLAMTDFSDLSQIYEISDETTIWYDFPELLRQHGHDLVGQYIRSFLPPGTTEEDLGEVKRQALHLGLRALLDSVDKR